MFKPRVGRLRKYWTEQNKIRPIKKRKEYIKIGRVCQDKQNEKLQGILVFNNFFMLTLKIVLICKAFSTLGF